MRVEWLEEAARRIARADALTIGNPRAERAHQTFDMMRAQREQGSDRGLRGFLIVGPTQSGKSKILRTYQERANTAEALEAGRIPVLMVTLTANQTRKGLAQDILRAFEPFGYLAPWKSGSETVLLDRVRAYMQARQVELLILDEFQHLVHSERQEVNISVSETIKWLLIESIVPVVMSGIQDAWRPVRANAQLAHRCEAPLELNPLDPANEADRGLFASFLSSYLYELERGSIAENATHLLHNPLVPEGLFEVAKGGRRVDFYGVALERRLLEATKRRFSPGALRQSAHARSSWMIRPLPFCPETMELLVDRCGTCGAGLTWQRCRTITKCEQCNSSLLTMEASTVPNDQREAARLCAKLVSDSEADRREALVAYPEPFNAWAAGDLFMAIVEFGLAVTTPDAQISRTNKKTGTGDFADFGLPDLLAGHDFAMRWPASLLEFVQDRYAQTKSASLRSCFGTLDKFFNPTSPPSPVRELLRANLSSAIELARVPVKQCVLKSRNCVSATTINAREAEARFGLFRAQLRRLQGGSETFVGGRSARGGTALYDIERLTQMARLRDSSLSTRQAAKALGIPIHVVGELAASGFIEEVADRDIALAFEELRYTRSSIEVLGGRLQHLQCGRVEAAATVERVLHGYADPQAWSRLLSGVLRGSVVIAGRTLPVATATASSLRSSRMRRTRPIGEAAGGAAKVMGALNGRRPL